MSTPEITTRIDAPAPTDERAIDAAVASAVAVIEAAATLEQLKAARLAQTGDKSPLALANRAIATLPKADKATAGRLIGRARTTPSVTRGSWPTRRSTSPCPTTGNRPARGTRSPP